MQDDLQAYGHSGSTLRFSPGERLPVALIKKIVKARVKENEERAISKKKK